MSCRLQGQVLTAGPTLLQGRLGSPHTLPSSSSSSIRRSGSSRRVAGSSRQQEPSGSSRAGWQGSRRRLCLLCLQAVLQRGCRTMLLQTVLGQCWPQHRQQLLLEALLLQQQLARQTLHTYLALRHSNSSSWGCPRRMLLLPQQLDPVAPLRQHQLLRGMPVLLVVVRSGCWTKRHWQQQQMPHWRRLQQLQACQGLGRLPAADPAAGRCQVCLTCVS